MKFGQAIEYNAKYIFFFSENHTQIVVEKLVPDPFLIICFPVYNVINVEINPSFLIKPFSYRT